MKQTFYFDIRQNYLQAEDRDKAVFKLVVVKNPTEYGARGSTKKQWQRAGVNIRSSSFRMCQGGISTGFFGGDKANDASVIFFLYFIARTRTGTHNEMIGFVLADDMHTYIPAHPGTLYIDAICANTDVRYVPEGGLKGAGTLLMRQVEWYARDSGEFDIIKLSALPYVINYYRKLGFRHVENCSDLRADQTPGHEGELVEKDGAILQAARKNLQSRFKSDTELQEAMRAELAKEKRIHAKGADKRRIELDYLLSNLNEYFRPLDIKFVTSVPMRSATTEDIVALDDENDIDPKITKLIHQDNRAVLDLLNELRGKGFSVECDERQAKHLRHNQRKDLEGDIEFHCIEEGFTMLKCLAMWPVGNEQDRPARGGRNRRSLRQKKNRTAIYNMVKRSNRRTRRTRRAVPWAGWGKIAPQGHARTVMKRRCGKKCFLGPDKSFPVCARGTCRINDKGLWAAYIRAREWGNKRSSYKGRARPRHARRVYTRVAGKARRALEKRGYRVGRSRRASRGGYRTRSRRCPAGSHHKIVGQRRGRSGRISRSGRMSAKCYRS